MTPPPTWLIIMLTVSFFLSHVVSIFTHRREGVYLWCVHACCSKLGFFFSSFSKHIKSLNSMKQGHVKAFEALMRMDG